MIKTGLRPRACFAARLKQVEFAAGRPEPRAAFGAGPAAARAERPEAFGAEPGNIVEGRQEFDGIEEAERPEAHKRRPAGHSPEAVRLA